MGLSALLWLFALAQSNPSEEGRKALEANNYPLAAEQFQKAVEADPKDWTARFHLALSLSLLNKDTEAIASYRQVLEQQPGVYEAELNLGILLLRQKDAAGAVKLLESAATKKPKEFRPVYHYAEALSAAGDAAKAEPAFRSALELQPKSADAAIGLARLLAKQSKLEEAAALYQQAAQNDPEYKRALLELAALYEQAKQTEKAVAIYREFPDDAAARERAGELLLEGGNASDAIPELEKAYSQSPISANRVALATAYLRSKQAVKALPLLQQAVAAEPANLELHLYYGRALRDQRNFQAAAGEFWKAAQIKPDSKEAWNELSAMLISLENYPQALAALDKAQALNGTENPAYWYFRAIVLDRMQDYKQAMPNYEKFLSLSQDKHPDEEFKSRERIKVIKKILSKR